MDLGAQARGWDDLMIFLAMVGSLGATSIIQVSVNLGFGRPLMAVVSEVGGLQNLVKIVKLSRIGYPFGVIAYSLPNVAILILFERIAGPTRTFSRNFLRITVVIQIILALVSTIFMYSRCRPIVLFGDPSAGSICVNDMFNYAFYVVNCFTIFTNLVLAVVPIHAFWKLQMKLQEKLEIAFLLGLTFLSAIFTTIKVYNMIDFYSRKSSDIIYDVVPLILWGLIEQNVVIIAACVPTLRPLLHLVKHKTPSRGRVITTQRPSAPERCSSTSEVPLGGLKYEAPRRSEPSLDALSGSEDWDGRPTTARYE
ncbi:hypothetical protein FGRMN_8896 [Fusarium graminum]|nr:hypothetical protein FGRMN_8896 [Fusarium graminum]